MTRASAARYRWAEVQSEVVSPILERRLISGDRVMLAQVSLKAGGVVPRHQHVHEQFACVLSGALHFVLGDGEEVVVRSGEVLHLPSNVWHEVRTLEDSTVLDIFSPPREDWLEKTDSYLRG